MMRPPVQKNTLQQNEAQRLQHHQQTHKHLQQQKELQQQPDIIATNISDLQQSDTIARKFKLEHRELLVENHLNSACFAQLHPHQQQLPTSHQQPLPTAPKTIARKSLPDHYNDCHRQPCPAFHLANSSSENNTRDSYAPVNLVELRTSPSPLDETLFETQTTSVEVFQNRTPSTQISKNSQQRYSFASQYSSRSSSSDESSSSLSYTTGCGNYPAPGGRLQDETTFNASGNHNLHDNTYDDAAENFVINFPADTSPLAAHCLPLSETEPLLTNIENAKQRSIYLNKNSASLIFTRKNLSAVNQAPVTTTYQAHQKQQQFKLQSRSNNNSNVTFSGSKNCENTTSAKRQSHSTLRSFSEENYKRKSTKHLPGTYHRQHRHSLQLNYNNNLVTTTTCIAIANNNHFCGSSSAVPACASNSNSAVLHKTHLNQHSYPKHQEKQQQQQQNKQPHQNCSSNTCTATNNTAAATRKQYAYSWYAPVYSALEEELEQDSRDTSPIHNLANTKKQNIQHYHQVHNANSLQAPSNDNETEALIENRHNVNIVGNTGESLTKQLHPTKLSIQHTRNSAGNSNIQGKTSAEEFAKHDLEGPHAGSLALGGGPQPRRIRFGNFLKSLVGLRPSVSNRSSSNLGASASNSTANGFQCGEDTPALSTPLSPEIRITRTPSEQNMVFLRDPLGYRDCYAYSSREKLAHLEREKVTKSGSTSSLNVVQQKLWNIVRRDGSAISLHQEKSQSIVHYTGIRKCETVLALTRQTTSPCSPTTVAAYSKNLLSENHATRLSQTGSGIFNACGVEQIRPLNRLRNSMTSMNNTCSRCSSLLSLAASSSRYSLSNSVNPLAHNSNQHLRNSIDISSSNVSSTLSRSRDESIDAGLHFSAKRNSRTSALDSQRNSSCGANSVTSSRTPSITSPTTTTATTASTIKLTTPPTDNTLSVPLHSPSPNALTVSMSFPGESLSTPLTVTSLLRVAEKEEATSINHKHNSACDNDDNCVESGDYNVIVGVYKINGGNTSGNAANKPFSSSSSSVNCSLMPNSQTNVTLMTNSMELLPTTFTETAATVASPTTSITQHCNNNNEFLTYTSSVVTPMKTEASTRPFQMFTCKLCLSDVESDRNSTTLHQCSCHFCTECMKAYVEFEISEGAYEISCPDAQCPEQGVMTLPEIAILTTNNLMKKHHRYRLNREIELDKKRTWCPRAGCETVCLIGLTSQSDATPSTSTSPTATTATASVNHITATPNGTNAVTTLCSVQCPSCKDEFCSACKKAWHPNISCEEHSRRLAADGQDDIGIPFDNDLIKCCPMCAVPIEKDEGCAQMMCKRCKHVFCWYCLASLDDDFLLRHYDKGPCKNKLGHSRASVVWHRAQVIGIFAGFGILLLVASPLFLLAAPCIICCKCRSCSGSKIEEGDGEMEEATALQSIN